jgi:hypothetical protein
MAEQKTFTIEYKQDEPRPKIPVSGMLGGTTADGTSIVAHVYIEHPTISSFDRYVVDATGGVDLSKPSERMRSGDITRQVVASMVFSPAIAEVVGKWLVEKAKDAEKARTLHKARNPG